MTLGSKEHDEIIAGFEKNYSQHSGRFDKEPKELWKQGIIYQDGEVNAFFIMYRQGYAHGRIAYLQSTEGE